jgi:prepilin signal peptidase PulO-like enzyme (type II secretory pathway)
LKHEPLALQFYRGGGLALCFNAALLAAMLLCLLTPWPLGALGLVVGGSLGAAAGGCLNHLHYRVSRGVPVFGPANHCPACLAPLRMRHTAPVVGWLIARGRCACCRSRIPPRYLLAELGGAAAGVALPAVLMGALG